MTRIALRALALIIALAAFVDPTVSSRRGSHPAITVMPADGVADSAAAARIARSLGRTFDVVRAPMPSTVATVVVGEALPAARDLVTSPVVAIEDPGESAPAIESVMTPSRAVIGSRISVSATVRSRDARTVAALRANGVQVDSVVLGRALATGGADSARMLRLTYAPASVGPVRLQVVASAKGAVTSADALVSVTDARWRVLFYDAHPSWMSTFVRRAIERDERFAVTSRVVTSRNISRDVGAPPARLGDPSVFAYDAIVVGAPEGLAANDVDGLEQYMRRRGGSVILLPDSDSAAAKRCCGPIGPGQLSIYGATNAWQHRDSTFDRTWQSIVAGAAASAIPPISFHVAPAILSPGDSGVVTVTSRDEFLSGTGALTIASSLDRKPIRLWPTSAPGEFRGTVIAPSTPGTYHMDVSVNGTTVSTPLVVASDARRPHGTSTSLFRAWVASRRGVTLASDRADDIEAAIEKVRAPSGFAEPWHPMRSAWWMLPFAAALCGEWWLRRRRGLR